MRWLWPGRLALGKVSLLEGDPGLGKSLITADLAARLTTGRPWPDGLIGDATGSVLILNGEDDSADTIRPRLEGLHADLDRVFVAQRPDTGQGLLRLPSELPELDHLLITTRARLLVIDPIMAFLDPGILAHGDQSIRRVMTPLTHLAETHQCAILLVRHLNKQGGTQAIYRGGGSIGLVAACRSAWLVAPDHAPHRRVLAQVKNNLAQPQPSLAFEIVRHPDNNLGLLWHGPSQRTANELLGTSSRGRPPHARARAQLFLLQLLGNGPLTTREIWRQAELHGDLSEITLRRARKELGIRTRRVTHHGEVTHYWLLPGQTLPNCPSANAPTDIEDLLAPLRERYPPASPLDDT